MSPIFLSALSACLLSFLQGREDPAVVLDPKIHHLGDDAVEEWAEFGVQPEGTRLDLTFQDRERSGESVLWIFQQDIHNQWTIELNGQEIGKLKTGDAGRSLHHLVPGGVLRTGENTLSLYPDKTSDDVLLGDIRIDYRSLREVLDLRPVEVVVTDGKTGEGVPVRLTVVDDKNEAVELYFAEAEKTAVRTGICYTRDGQATMEIPSGRYTIYATRGMEWSMARGSVEVGDQGGDGRLALQIVREVDTSGYVSADTHIHTLTHSGHGDSSVEERMVTLAGEGVELAIATDHNHNIDYRPTQERMQLNSYFTPVIGNEVTTPVGHFNAFPLDDADEVPPHELKDWVELIDGIRERGAKVVILNHPRWPSIEKGPYGEFAFDRASGRFGAGQEMPVDAIEIINSTWLLEDPIFKYQDWFALLNRGSKVNCVGSSDSHTVGAPVGQGRTYVRSSTDDPSRIKIEEACRSFLDGDTSVSLGIFSEATVDGQHGMGSLVACRSETVSFAVRVASPSWVTPRRIQVFLNGEVVAERELTTEEGKPTDQTQEFIIEKPEIDGYLVSIVTGDPVDGPAWTIPGPYTLASTNPIFLDADADGSYDSPRETARKLLARTATAELRDLLASTNDVVAIQLLDLVCEQADDTTRRMLLDLSLRPSLKRFLESRLSG